MDKKRIKSTVISRIIRKQENNASNEKCKAYISNSDEFFTTFAKFSFRKGVQRVKGNLMKNTVKWDNRTQNVY